MESVTVCDNSGVDGDEDDDEGVIEGCEPMLPLVNTPTSISAASASALGSSNSLLTICVVNGIDIEVEDEDDVEEDGT